MKRRVWIVMGLVMMIAGSAGGCDCGGDDGPGHGGTDAGGMDAGEDDGGTDAGMDAGAPDAGAPDAGPIDGGSMDGGTPDAGPPDAGPPDAGPPDAGPPDAGPPDAGPPDAGTPDAGPPDAGPPDAGPSCTSGTVDGDETDVDCGGTMCEPCALGQHCALDRDCADADCRLGICIDGDSSSCGPMPVTLPDVGFADPAVFSNDPMMIGVGSIVPDGSGGFYAQDPYGNGPSGDRILHVDATGVATTLAVTGGSLCTSNQLAIRGSSLFVYNVDMNVLQQITTAGVVSTFSTVGGIGGGSSCSDSGVIGLLVQGDGSFLATSTGGAALFALSADGSTRSTVLMPFAAAYRLADDDPGTVLALAMNAIVRVELGPPATASTLFDVSPLGGISALRRDGAGDIYFAVGRNVLRVDAGGGDLTLVARCFPGPITDLLFAPARASGGGTSLYVTEIGAGIVGSPGTELEFAL